MFCTPRPAPRTPCRGPGHWQPASAVRGRARTARPPPVWGNNHGRCAGKPRPMPNRIRTRPRNGVSGRAVPRPPAPAPSMPARGRAASRCHRRPRRGAPGRSEIHGVEKGCRPRATRISTPGRAPDRGGRGRLCARGKSTRIYQRATRRQCTATHELVYFRAMKAIHILNAAKFVSLLLTVSAGLLAGAAPAAAVPSADEIVAKAYKVDGGQDGVSRLSFTFSKPGAADKRLAYTMVWKSYGGKDNLDIKLIFFADFPPDDRGKAFLTYVYTDRMDDQWIYLPELRMVRKMSHDPDQHRPDDDFAHSVLGRFDLVPRDPAADQHQLVREETYEGHPYYVIESAPKRASEQYPYSKIERCIPQDSNNTGRIDYYRDRSTPDNRQYLGVGTGDRGRQERQPHSAGCERRADQPQPQGRCVQRPQPSQRHRIGVALRRGTARSALAGLDVEIAFGVERRHAAGAGRSDGLAIDVIRYVARREHARHAGGSGVALDTGFHFDVPMRHVQLAFEDGSVGGMTDGDEDTLHRHIAALAAAGEVCDAHAGDAALIAQHFFQGMIPDDLDVTRLGLLHQLVLENLLALEPVAAVHQGDLRGNVGKIQRLFDGSVAAAVDRHGLVLVEETVAGGAG